MGIRESFRWLSNLGTQPGQSTGHRRRIALTNQFAMLAAAIFLAFVPLSLVFHSTVGDGAPWPLMADNAAGALGCLAALWLNAHGRATPAAYVLIVTASVFNVGAAYLLGTHVILLYYYFPLVLSPWLLFEDRARLHRGILGTFCFACFATIRWVLPPQGRVRLPLSSLGLSLFEGATVILVTFLLAMIVLFFTRATARAEAQAAEALARSEELLLNILPASISARLKAAGRSLADGHADVTVLFADLVGFTQLSANLPPADVVRMLNEIFSRFDDLSERLGLEKIKTIGDAYMVAGGLPEPRADHVEAVARMALEMQRSIAELNMSRGGALELRIGLHTGPVVAGVIGKRKFIYDLWGDTVNTASRMESSGLPGAIQITREVRDRLAGRFLTEPRGSIEVKGKGQMETFWLRGEGAPSR